MKRSLGKRLVQKGVHQSGNLGAIGFQCEVTSVYEMELKVFDVAFVRFCSGRRKDLVVLTPNDKHRRLMFAKVLLPFRIQRRVASVAEEQIELKLLIASSIEQELIVRRTIRTNPLNVLDSMSVQSAAMTSSDNVSLKKRTERSAKATLAPPGCKLAISSRLPRRLLMEPSSWPRQCAPHRDPSVNDRLADFEKTRNKLFRNLADRLVQVHRELGDQEGAKVWQAKIESHVKTGLGL